MTGTEECLSAKSSCVGESQCTLNLLVLNTEYSYHRYVMHSPVLVRNACGVDKRQQAAASSYFTAILTETGTAMMNSKDRFSKHDMSQPALQKDFA